MGRLCVGSQWPASCQASPSTIRRPWDARSRPAIHRSKVVLPEPDGPNTAVTPCPGRWISTSREKPGQSSTNRADIPCASSSFSGMRAPGIEDQQDQEGEGQHDCSQAMRLTVLECFYIIVYLYRRDTRDAGKIATYHENHAKLAHRIRKGKNGCRQEPGCSKRHGHREERIQRRSAQCRSQLQRPFTDGFERTLQGLDHERQRIEHRGNHQPPE